VAKHFTDAEIVGLQPQLVEMLDAARDAAGVPFVITSGLRTPEQNSAAGGVQDSAHLRGLAVDLADFDPATRFAIVKSLLAVGFTRIGVYADGHLHCDCDSSLPQSVMWVGK
jgi:zinc D-Ala-D-Ala carboxypeptidase